MNSHIEEKVDKFLRNLVDYIEISIECASRNRDDSGMGRSPYGAERDMKESFESLIESLVKK